MAGQRTDPLHRKRMVNRLAKLLVLCQTSRRLPHLTVLASSFGVSTRTIRRDLEALEEAYVPVPPLTLRRAA